LVNRGWGPNSSLSQRLYPNPIACPQGKCDTVFLKRPTFGISGGDSLIDRYPFVRYPVGRYSTTDSLAKNGFVYFYAVTAFDSSGRGTLRSSYESRRAALEADGVVPQDQWSSTRNGGNPYVVPNPYRGRSDWDLEPSAADPTGTHVDFLNLPAGWSSLRIFTLNGDLVQEIRTTDVQTNGRPQSDGPQDAEASWNLISRNGQDVVSGIYLYSVSVGNHVAYVGRFVVIR